MRRFCVWLSSLGLALLAGAAGGVPDGGRASELERLLVQDCGSCHGLSGRGGLGPPLLASALAGKPRELLLLSILDGRPGTAMPPWRGLLQAGDAEWLVDRILTRSDPLQ